MIRVVLVCILSSLCASCSSQIQNPSGQNRLQPGQVIGGTVNADGKLAREIPGVGVRRDGPGRYTLFFGKPGEVSVYDAGFAASVIPNLAGETNFTFINHYFRPDFPNEIHIETRQLVNEIPVEGFLNQAFFKSLGNSDAAFSFVVVINP